MKKVFFMAVACIAALSTACSKDDEGSIDMSQLYGSWQEIHSTGYAISIESGNKIDEWDESITDGAIYTFYENGTGSISNGTTATIRYTQSGKTLQLTIVYSANETLNRTWTIESLSSTQLKSTVQNKGAFSEEYETRTFRRVN